MTISPTESAEIDGETANYSPGSPSPDAGFIIQNEHIIKNLASKAIEQESLVGLTIGIRCSDQLPAIKYFGYADLENQMTVQENTVYMLGSVTKQFTAAAILRLFDQGELDLDDQIYQYLPKIPQKWERITIRQLLNHTGGIPNYATDSMEFDIGQPYTPEELMVKLTQWDLLNFEPGTRWEYSNRGYFLLGMVIKNITGQNYDDFLREQILAPLGIAHTQACVDVTQDLARGYRIFFLGGKPEYVDEVNPSFAYGAGDLCSTAMDLLEWQRALAMGRVVSNESYAMMISPTVLPDGTQTGYGFGLDIAENDGRKVIGHAGGIPSGFITQLSNYPDEYCGIVLLTNTLTPAYNPLASLESELVKALFASP